MGELVKVYPPTGYRKWWLAAQALIFTEANMLLGKLDSDQWVLSMVAILGVVGFSAVGGKVADSLKRNNS